MESIETLMAQPFHRLRLRFDKMPAVGAFGFDCVRELSRVEDSVFLEVTQNLPAVMCEAVTLDIIDIETQPVTLEEVTLAALAVWPLVAFFAMLSLFIGALMPSRRIAAVTATVILVFSYFGKNLASMVDWLRWIQPILAFYYFDSANLMIDGPDAQNTLILLAAGAISLVLAFYQLRNVTVGARPWQWARIPSTQQRAEAITIPSVRENRGGAGIPSSDSCFHLWNRQLRPRRIQFCLQPTAWGRNRPGVPRRVPVRPWLWRWRNASALHH